MPYTTYEYCMLLNDTYFLGKDEGLDGEEKSLDSVRGVGIPACLLGYLSNCGLPAACCCCLLRYANPISTQIRQRLATRCLPACCLLLALLTTRNHTALPQTDEFETLARNHRAPLTSHQISDPALQPFYTEILAFYSRSSIVGSFDVCHVWANSQQGTLHCSAPRWRNGLTSSFCEF